MPRLSQTVAQKQYSAVLAHIAVYTDEKERGGWDSSRIANALGFKYMTLHNRKKKPQSFTFGELQNIANVLNITLPTLMGCERT